ncbi:MAG: ATP-binding protein [bacterium]|nr:ATP-binding protein [bacterium]
MNSLKKELKESEKRHKENELKLFETNQRLRALLNALPVGVSFSNDLSCEHITGNPAMFKHLEMKPCDNISASTSDPSALGRRIRHFHNGKEMKPSELPMQRAINENREIHPIEIEVYLPSGKKLCVEASAAPIHDMNGKIAGSVAVNVDLTERKRLQAFIEEQKRYETEKIKGDFIADATHELRTPLAIIKGHVDLVLPVKKKSVSAAYSAFRAINEEIQHLSNLLSDLTLLTSTESAEVERKIIFHKINLSHLVRRVVGRCKMLANKKRITISLRISPDINVLGDKMYLEKLFINIITNAIQYCGEKGKVVISDSRDGDMNIISVSDNGIGISEKNLPNIFNRFYRADSARLINHGGTGLGLAICKWIAEMHGGNIWVDSIEGKGTTFYVSLPSDNSILNRD